MPIALKREQDWLTDLQVLSQQTPFMLIDLAEARANVRRIEELMPGVDLYYAVAGNNDQYLLREVGSSTAGFAITSLGELHTLQDIGAQVDRVIFSNPVKIPEHVSRAHAAGVHRYSFGCLMEVEKLAANAPGSHAYARVAINAATPELLTQAGEADVSPAQVVACMKRAAMMGLQANGLTFQLAAASNQPETWIRAIRICGQLVQQLVQDGIGIAVLDIGELPMADSRNTSALPLTMQAITEALTRYIPPTIQIVAEPGRAIAATCAVLATTVISRRPDLNGREWLFLDSGVFHGIRARPDDTSYSVFTGAGFASHTQRQFTLAGPTGDPSDMIGHDYLLPDTIRAGDRVYFAAAGAYSLSQASSFGGFDPPAVCRMNATNKI